MVRIRDVALPSLAVILLAACSTGASAPPPAPVPAAQTAPTPPPPMDMATRLKVMHDQLGITPTQEPIWNRFGNSLLAASAKVTALQDAKAQNASSMTVMQGMKAQQDMLSAQMSGMHQVMPAAQHLYSSMTPDQQAKWNDMMRANDGPTCGYDCYLLHHY